MPAISSASALVFRAAKRPPVTTQTTAQRRYCLLAL